MRVLVLAAMAALLAGCAAGPETSFEAVKDSPPRLRAFLAAMPKGADLHSHLGGASYAEANLAAGAKAGHCLELATQKIVRPPCDPARTPALAEIMAGGAKGQDAINRAIDGQSMRHFVAAPGVNGHDQFFATFAKFGDGRDAGLMVAEVLNRAGHQNVQHVELMLTLAGPQVAALGAATPWSGGFDSQLARLEAGGLAQLVPQARAELDAITATARAAMACDGAAPQPGCAVSVRFLQQITRTAQPEVVAAQTAFAFMLAAADGRVAGINIVAPEDAVVALRDYGLHMAMIGAMAACYPQVGVALHAGELTLGLVPPEQLRGHIRDAIQVGRARRIGHGVDAMYEDDPAGLLRLMAQRRVTVEIALSSNDLILGVKGADHPFNTYRAAGVPLTLSTDDEGVSRIDLTHEYQRAVQDQGVDYAGLKALSRTGLEAAFLPGASLWADVGAWRMVPACDGGDGAACTAFLATSEKATRQYALEAAFRRFEDGLQPGR